MSNSFANLECDDQQESEIAPKEKIIKAPPIFMDKVGNIYPLIKVLKSTVKNNYKLKKLRDKQVKIQPKSTLAYTTIVKEVRNRNTEFHRVKLK